MNPMDPRNDPLWKIGEHQQQQQINKGFQIAQGWANKEQFFQNLIFHYLGWTIPRAILIFLWRYARSVSSAYIVSPIILLAAYIAGAIGWTWQRRAGGFSHLDASSYPFVVVILTVAALLVVAALAAVFWGFVWMTWAGQILALFYLYSWGVWFIHFYVASQFQFRPVGQAWFFCLLASIAIEVPLEWWKRRKAGLPSPSPI